MQDKEIRSNLAENPKGMAFAEGCRQILSD